MSDAPPLAWYVQIIEDATGKCVKQMTAYNERNAEKIQRGAMINLNHDDFSVVISNVSKEVKDED